MHQSSTLYSTNYLNESLWFAEGKQNGHWQHYRNNTQDTQVPQKKVPEPPVHLNNFLALTSDQFFYLFQWLSSLRIWGLLTWKGAMHQDVGDLLVWGMVRYSRCSSLTDYFSHVLSSAVMGRYLCNQPCWHMSFKLTQGAYTWEGVHDLLNACMLVLCDWICTHDLSAMMVAYDCLIRTSLKWANE